MNKDRKKPTFGARIEDTTWDGLVRGREVAAAWTKTEDGEEAISVRVRLSAWEEINFVLRKNNRKTSDSQPDYTARTMIWRKN